MSVKINARLDDALAKRVAQLVQRTGKPLTEIVKDALARHCDAELAASPSPFEALVNAGLVGVAEGPADLSTRYKDELRESLGRKTR